MPIFSFGTSSIPGTSTRTYAEAKRMVARVVGAADKPDEVGAGDAIGQAIDELNTYRWDYLTVRGSDITTYDHRTRTIGQEGYLGQYSLPYPIKDPLSCNMVGTTPRILTFVNRLDWDMLIDESGVVGGTYFYTNFEYGQTGKIQLLDPPTSGGTLEIRYYRPIAKPLSNEVFLDVPDGPLQAALVTKSQFYVAQWNSLRSERVQQLDFTAERLLARAKRDDRVKQGADYFLIPNILTSRSVANVNAVPRLSEQT